MQLYSPIRQQWGGQQRRHIEKILGVDLKNLVFETEDQARQFALDVAIKVYPGQSVDAQSLNAKDEDKVKRATAAETAKLHRAFHEQVEIKVREKVADRQARLDGLNEQAIWEIKRYQMMRDGLRHFMTLEEYRLILNCLHPDRAPEDRRQRFAEAFAVMKRLGKAFE